MVNFASTQKFYVSSHRGAPDISPEGSIISIQNAIDLGCDIIEIDVRPSKDGVFYNFHDSVFDRNTDSTGVFCNKLSKEIDQINLIKYSKNSRLIEKIPKVEEILRIFDKKIYFYFDIKPETDIDSFMQLVKKYKLIDRCFFWFKSKEVLSEFVRKHPFYSVKVNVDSLADAIKYTKLYNPTILECSLQNYSKDIYAYCRKQRIKLMLSIHNKERNFSYIQFKYKFHIVNVHNLKPLVCLKNKNKGA